MIPIRWLPLIVGFGLILFGGRDLFFYFRGTAEPHKVTLAELGQPGSIRSVHVTVTDFQAGRNSFTLKKGDRIQSIWTPLLEPNGAVSARPVIAYQYNITDPAAWQKTLEQPSLTGIVTNGMQGVGRTQREGLSSSYPNADFSEAIAFHVGKPFPSALVPMLITSAGVALMVGYALWLFGLVRLGRPEPALDS